MRNAAASGQENVAARYMNVNEILGENKASFVSNYDNMCLMGYVGHNRGILKVL